MKDARVEKALELDKQIEEVQNGIDEDLRMFGATTKLAYFELKRLKEEHAKLVQVFN